MITGHETGVRYMYEEQDREDHLSLDFHTGVTPGKQFRLKINIVALLLFLQIVAYVGASYINERLYDQVYRLFGNDLQTVDAVVDVIGMFETALSFLLPLWVVLLIFRDRIFRPYIPFAPNVPPHAIFTAFFCCAVLYMVGNISSEFLLWLQNLGIPLRIYEPSIPTEPVRIVLYFISSVILPAFVEEMIFRGYILHLLLPHGKTFAIMVSAVLFGLMHLYLPQLLYATIAGVLIGYYVVRSGSLWIGIFIHVLNNLFAFLTDMAYVFLSRSAYQVFNAVFQSVILLIGIIGALVICVRNSGVRHEVPLETQSVYNRPLDTPTALRYTLTVPMITYLLLTVYYTVMNSFRF